jgi:hypothetical protein
LKLDLFLASLMRQNDDLRRRLESAGISGHDLRQAKERARSAGLLRPFHVTPEIFTECFGPPARIEGEVLTYELALWPRHLYEVGIQESSWITHRGFLLKEPDIPRTASLELSVVKTVFTIGHHTQREVEGALGSAAKVEAWNPMEDWLYGPVSGEQYTVFEFDFGLLSGAVQRPPTS